MTPNGQAIKGGCVTWRSHPADPGTLGSPPAGGVTVSNLYCMQLCESGFNYVLKAVVCKNCTEQLTFIVRVNGALFIFNQCVINLVILKSRPIL
jgi:hypothetical protein